MANADTDGAAGQPGDPGGSGRPLLRLVRGDATPEEIAALVAVLTARAAAAAAPPPPPPRSLWADPSHALRTPLAPGPDGWRRAGRAAGLR
ncbi:MAG: acyl-CoA carboxylase subunit epsilon [Frankia sp.]|nr:acyl-CoA carboxylase subunit epsilon [Frankia sp.]